MNGNGVILSVKNLVKHFPITKGIFLQKQVGAVHAVDDISFEVSRGEILGLVGESGCGKTTTGRTIIQLEEPTSGEIIFNGVNLAKAGRKELFNARRKIQMIFQDPYASLNPRMTVKEIIEEPMVIHGINDAKFRTERAKDLLDKVGLNPSYINRYPHEFSGGQRQRIGIARALSLQPEMIICDEPISALDVSIQAQIINLLEDLQTRHEGLSYLFIAHDLSVVRHISDRIAVMYLGHIFEVCKSRVLYENPLHPYTRALLSAVPIADPVIEETRERIILKGEVPSPLNPPSGCPFHPRCFMATPECAETVPPLRDVGDDHYVACIRV